MPEGERRRSEGRQGGILGEIVGAEIKFTTLLLDLPAYRQQLSRILREPVGFVGGLTPGAPRLLKRAVSFMIQGATLGFVLLTLGWVLPQSLAGFIAVNVAIVSESPSGLVSFVGRVEELDRALPADLAQQWREQAELMLLLRSLPDEAFRTVVGRTAALARENPGLIRAAIDGSLGGEDRFGGRGYLLSFFLALNPGTGPLLHRTHQIVYSGPRHELKPHVAFLLRTALLWYLTCATLALLLGTRTDDTRKRAVFALGALLVGFWTPVVEALRTLVHLYLAATLPTFIVGWSRLATAAPGPPFDAWSSGVFPYEHLVLAGIRIMAYGAVLALALAALARGGRVVAEVSAAQAWAAAVVAAAVGLGLTQAAVGLLAIILAPTGLM